MTRSEGIATIEPAEGGGFLIGLPEGCVDRTSPISAEALYTAWAGATSARPVAPASSRSRWRDGANPVRQVRTEPRRRGLAPSWRVSTESPEGDRSQ